MNRPGVHTAATVASELAWLDALHRDVRLGVPVPVATLDGQIVIEVGGGDLPGSRVAALFRWLDGRFVDAGLRSAHAGAIGRLMAALQDHAASWTATKGFERPRVDTLTTPGKVASIASVPLDGEVPAHDDEGAAAELVAGLVSQQDSGTVRDAVAIVRRTTAALAADGEGTGLLHADLHQDNVLFAAGTAKAIDFDDCGWGFWLYDLAVPLLELQGRPAYPVLRDALLAGYGARRPLPRDADRHIAAFMLLRRLQLLLWIIESREHPAFRDEWQPWAREELDALRVALAAQPSLPLPARSTKGEP
jgi:Ser/Thr protein kinase RdoA (MazF antagonist)